MLPSVYVCLLHRTQESILLTIEGNPNHLTSLSPISAKLSNSCGLCPLQDTAPKLAHDEPLQWRWVLLLIRTDLWGVVSSWLRDAVQTRGERIQSSLKNTAASFIWQLYHRLTSEEKKCLSIRGGRAATRPLLGRCMRLFHDSQPH